MEKKVQFSKEPLSISEEQLISDVRNYFAKQRKEGEETLSDTPADIRDYLIKKHQDGFIYNDFANRWEVTKMDWTHLTHDPKEIFRYKDHISASIYSTLNKEMKIKSRQNLADALLQVYNDKEQNGKYYAKRYNPVIERIKSFKWDGVKRLETLLPTSLGADDNEYIHTLTIKMFMAMIERVQESLKFNYLPVLEGGEGLAKTEFLQKLCFDSNLFLQNFTLGNLSTQQI